MPTMDDHFMDVEREAQKSRPALSWGGKYGNNSILYSEYISQLHWQQHCDYL